MDTERTYLIGRVIATAHIVIRHLIDAHSNDTHDIRTVHQMRAVGRTLIGHAVNTATWRTVDAVSHAFARLSIAYSLARSYSKNGKHWHPAIRARNSTVMEVILRPRRAAAKARGHTFWQHR